ncbi:MAG: DUF423 domain-containing protein [Pirellulaceae bacterium]|nr:DUF423 domain-containing protein [Pirellulaceae bacterium]
MEPNKIIALGAILAACAVITGAFGAHGLETSFAEQEKAGTIEKVEVKKMLDTWEVAVRYQMYHAIGILVVGLVMAVTKSATKKWLWIVALLFGGTLIFSGLLYLLVLTGIKILGAIVPIGGLMLIGGWLLFAIQCWREMALDVGKVDS